MKKEKSGLKIQPESNDSENISETQEKETVAGKIIVRDIYSGETYPLEKISMHYPVFIEISASWCPACKEMEKTTEKLHEYFKGKVFFIRLFMAGDGSLDENSIIPSMEIASSPEEMKIEYSEALPRIIILSREGVESIADLTGTYPLIYYYGILSEL
jgi:thiol-disulfide isomerase/thioredoxin